MKIGINLEIILSEPEIKKSCLKTKTIFRLY